MRIKNDIISNAIVEAGTLRKIDMIINKLKIVDKRPRALPVVYIDSHNNCICPRCHTTLATRHQQKDA